MKKKHYAICSISCIGSCTMTIVIYLFALDKTWKKIQSNWLHSTAALFKLKVDIKFSNHLHNKKYTERYNRKILYEIESTVNATNISLPWMDCYPILFELFRLMSALHRISVRAWHYTKIWKARVVAYTNDCQSDIEG